MTYSTPELRNFINLSGIARERTPSVMAGEHSPSGSLLEQLSGISLSRRGMLEALAASAVGGGLAACASQEDTSANHSPSNTQEGTPGSTRTPDVAASPTAESIRRTPVEGREYFTIDTHEWTGVAETAETLRGAETAKDERTALITWAKGNNVMHPVKGLSEERQEVVISFPDSPELNEDGSTGTQYSPELSTAAFQQTMALLDIGLRLATTVRAIEENIKEDPSYVSPQDFSLEDANLIVDKMIEHFVDPAFYSPNGIEQKINILLDSSDRISTAPFNGYAGDFTDCPTLGIPGWPGIGAISSDRTGDAFHTPDFQRATLVVDGMQATEIPIIVGAMSTISEAPNGKAGTTMETVSADMYVLAPTMNSDLTYTWRLYGRGNTIDDTIVVDGVPKSRADIFGPNPGRRTEHTY